MAGVRGWGARSRRGAVVAVTVVTTLAVVVGGVVLATHRQWFPGLADCRAEVAGGTVNLSTGQAERAAAVAARDVRRGVRLLAATTAVQRAAHLTRQEARSVATALTGRAEHAFSCRHGGSDATEPDRLDARGLTGRAEVVRRDLLVAFGPQPLGGFAPGGVTSGHTAGSAHYEGRALDVFYRPIGPRQRVRGWATAQYLVANAHRLALDTVIFDGHIWTARRAGEGWRAFTPDTTGRSRSVAQILEHRDHVHVDVAD